MSQKYKILSYPYKLFYQKKSSNINARLRQLIEQVLFVSPGERVNRPEFGTGLQNLVFMPNHDELNPLYQLMIQSALQQWLGEEIDLINVNIEQQEEQLTVIIGYRPINSTEENQEILYFDTNKLFN